MQRTLTQPADHRDRLLPPNGRRRLMTRPKKNIIFNLAARRQSYDRRRKLRKRQSQLAIKEEDSDGTFFFLAFLFGRRPGDWGTFLTPLISHDGTKAWNALKLLALWQTFVPHGSLRRPGSASSFAALPIDGQLEGIHETKLNREQRQNACKAAEKWFSAF